MNEKISNAANHRRRSEGRQGEGTEQGAVIDRGAGSGVETLGQDSQPPTEADGVKAIIFLQSLADIQETEAGARAHWNNLSPLDRAKTILAERTFRRLEANQ